MPKRKQPELKPEEQFERFKETVRKLEIDETGKDLESAFNKVARGQATKRISPK
jgi:hypothetical protein